MRIHLFRGWVSIGGLEFLPQFLRSCNLWPSISGSVPLMNRIAEWSKNWRSNPKTSGSMPVWRKRMSPSPAIEGWGRWGRDEHLIPKQTVSNPHFANDLNMFREKALPSILFVDVDCEITRCQDHAFEVTWGYVVAERHRNTSPDSQAQPFPLLVLCLCFPCPPQLRPASEVSKQTEDWARPSTPCAVASSGYVMTVARVPGTKSLRLGDLYVHAIKTHRSEREQYVRESNCVCVCVKFKKIQKSLNFSVVME